MKEAAGAFQMTRPDPDALQDKLPAATEKEIFPLDEDIRIGKPVECDAGLSAAIEEAEDSPDPVLAVHIASAQELDEFELCQYAVKKPLCIVTEDAEALEGALRVYQGRAMYEGNLPEKVLSPLAEKYGLVYGLV